MKKVLLLLMVAILLFCASCVESIQAITYTPLVTTSTSVSESNVLVNSPSVVPTATPLVIKTKEDLADVNSDIVYPCVIIFSDYLTGVNTNFWMQDDNTKVFGHNQGDVMAIKIYNSHDEPCVFSIKYSNDFLPTPYSGTGDTQYVVAPQDTVNWVNIKFPTVSLQPHELATIPFSFKIPVGTIVPDKFEFRLIVTNETYSGQFRFNTGVRCLVTMQKP